MTHRCLHRSIQEAHAIARTTNLARFEQADLTACRGGLQFARWLTRDEHNAEDVVQDAYVRALTFFDSSTAGTAAPGCSHCAPHVLYLAAAPSPAGPHHEFDERFIAMDAETSNPETLLLQGHQQLLRAALDSSALEYREVVVLREWRGLSYKEIAGITDLPLGRSCRAWPVPASGCRPGMPDRLHQAGLIPLRDA